MARVPSPPASASLVENASRSMAGPLAGIRIVELAGIGPGPFGAMLLSDLGADVLRVDRPAPVEPEPGRPAIDLLARNRRSVVVDLKRAAGVELVLALAERADAFVEGFRPGVAERLGVGPEACRSRNPRLVYGRVTGWGREGPLAGAAGHDINYVALSGALDAIGVRGGPPVPPLNLLGDFAGGGLLLALGVVSALLEARDSGTGQVVDAAMVDGAALLTTFVHALRADGSWSGGRGENLLDGGAPFYGVYETADGEHVSVGALEPRFYAELARLAGLPAASEAERLDTTRWPEARARLAALFRTRTRAGWCSLLEGTDACFAPVLSFEEAAAHPHNTERHTFVEVEGVVQPAPAPRFSRTRAEIARPPARPGDGGDEALRDWGLDSAEIAELRRAGALRRAQAPGSTE